MNNGKQPEKITYNSPARLSSIKFDNNDILKTIRSLNVNKAHGHDGILVDKRMIRMIKMHDESGSDCDLFSGVVLILVFIQILINLSGNLT